MDEFLNPLQKLSEEIRGKKGEFNGSGKDREGTVVVVGVDSEVWTQRRRPQNYNGNR